MSAPPFCPLSDSYITDEFDVLDTDKWDYSNGVTVDDGKLIGTTSPYGAGYASLKGSRAAFTASLKYYDCFYTAIFDYRAGNAYSSGPLAGVEFNTGSNSLSTGITLTGAGFQFLIIYNANLVFNLIIPALVGNVYTVNVRVKLISDGVKGLIKAYVDDVLVYDGAITPAISEGDYSDDIRANVFEDYRVGLYDQWRLERFSIYSELFNDLAIPCAGVKALTSEILPDSSGNVSYLNVLEGASSSDELTAFFNSLKDQL